MTKELEAKDKTAVSVEGEQTRPGPLFVPNVDIYESEDGMTLLADMPGVVKDGLTIDLKDNILTIRGNVPQPEDDGPNVIYREYETGDYYRQFTLSEKIAQEEITAALKDGVLTLFLPKSKPASPRRIEVKGE